MQIKKTSQLQKAMANYPKKAKVLAVTSGKGGVGKTNISANLSVCLASAGKRTVLMDADFSLGNLDIILNINSKYNIGDMIFGQKSVEEIMQVGPEGVEVICGVSGLEDIANINEFQRQRLLSELAKLEQTADNVVIDTAAGITSSVVGFCLAADHTLVVTTPEPPAMTDAYAMIKVLVKNNYAGPISLVVNMAESKAEAKKVYQQIAQVCQRFLQTHIYDGGYLIKDPKLTMAVKMRKPVVLAYPRSKISLSLIALAAKLDRCCPAKSEDNGFLKKVVNWFF